MQASVIPGILAGLGLLLLFTAIIYRLYPLWQARQLGLERLDATQVPDLVHDFDELCTAAQLRRRPELWWNPLDGRMLALAFGTGSHPRIGLTGAMVLQHQAAPGAFAAIMLHELAHIRNGDVALTYLSLSVWWAYLVTALLPSVFILGSFGIDWSGHFEFFGIIVFATDVGFMTACVLLMRNAVLRARELYADARSSVWVDNAADLRTVLIRPAARLAGLRQLMSRHPGPAQRLELLNSTDGMFRFTGWDGFSTGFASGLMGVSMFFITVWLPDSPALALTFAMPLLAATLLVVSVTGIGMWRTSFLALIRGHPPPSVFPTAIACALGALTGGLLPTAMSMMIIVGQGGQLLDAAKASAASVVVAGVVLCLAFLLLVTLTLMAFLRWFVATAACWLTTGPATAAPSTKFTICLSIASVVATLAIVFAPQGIVLAAYDIFRNWNTSRYDGLTTIFFFTSSFAWVFPFGPALWLACLAIWALPLSAGLLPRRRAIGTWAFLGASAAAPPTSLSSPKLRRSRAATIGICGGIAAVLLSVVLHGHGLVGREALAGTLDRLLTGALAQGVTAVVAVAAIPVLAIPHAMFAGWFAGVTYVVVESLRLNIAQGLTLLLAKQLVLPMVLFDGALFALLCACAAWLLLFPLRRLMPVR